MLEIWLSFTHTLYLGERTLQKNYNYRDMGDGKSRISGLRKMKNTITVKSIKIIIIILILSPSVGFAGTYWVHPNGSASWANCQSDTDPGSNYCSLSTANTNAQAGDTVYFKGGRWKRKEV